jgi:hypothetical protein
MMLMRCFTARTAFPIPILEVRALIPSEILAVQLHALHSHFLRKERMSRPRDFRICATGHKGATADIRHKTSSKGRLPNGHATALPTDETIPILRKVQCRRSTTSPWLRGSGRIGWLTVLNGVISGANISDQSPSLSLGRSTKGHLREDRYRTIFSPMRPI